MTKTAISKAPRTAQIARSHRFDVGETLICKLFISVLSAVAQTEWNIHSHARADSLHLCVERMMREWCWGSHRCYHCCCSTIVEPHTTTQDGLLQPTSKNVMGFRRLRILNTILDHFLAFARKSLCFRGKINKHFVMTQYLRVFLFAPAHDAHFHFLHDTMRARRTPNLLFGNFCIELCESTK